MKRKNKTTKNRAPKNRCKTEFGDCREIMRRWKEKGVKVNTCVTSPPYFGLRNYLCDGQIGLEKTSDEYVQNLVEVFRCVRDVLSDNGTVWLNLGDSYAKRVSGDKKSLKPKNLIGIPWRVAFALQEDGWYLRQDIIWHKANPMPESVTDRCTKAHEYVFLLSKSPKYYFDSAAIEEEAAYDGRKDEIMKGSTKYKDSEYTATTRQTIATKGQPRWRKNEQGDRVRNKRSVWKISQKPYSGAHFATFPLQMVEPCILAGCPKEGVVLDPFMGSGTTAVVALNNNRKYLGCELNEEYRALQKERIQDEVVLALK